MKFTFTKLTTLVASVAVTMSVSAQSPKVAMLVATTNTDALNAQEKAAALFFDNNIPNSELVSIADVNTITPDKYAAVWVHVDGLNIGMGVNNLHDGYGSAEVVSALKSYLENGGNIYLSKHATQLTSAIGRIPASYAPGIFSAGDGGDGSDVWTIQAIIGAMNGSQYFPNPEAGRTFDATQVYDHTAHAIYADLETLPAHHQYADFVTATYPMEGTGTGANMWREDHNCMWDLNAYSYAAAGKNTTEQFEADFNCDVIGTWGHVQDYCVAGIVEFKPVNNGGIIIANGLAACEWAPRNGGNAYHSNLEKLTANTMSYLAKKSSGIDSVIVSDEDAEEEYYNLNGVRVNPESAAAGVYIVKQGSKVTKKVIR